MRWRAAGIWNVESGAAGRQPHVLCTDYCTDYIHCHWRPPLQLQPRLRCSPALVPLRHPRDDGEYRLRTLYTALPPPGSGVWASPPRPTSASTRALQAAVRGWTLDAGRRTLDGGRWTEDSAISAIPWTVRYSQSMLGAVSRAEWSAAAVEQARRPSHTPLWP